MGNHKLFTERFERLLPVGSRAQKVFISDGALWIANWLEARYGNDSVTCILDYYHVTEKLGAVAGYAADAKAWMNRQCERLLGGAASDVVAAVGELTGIDQPQRQRMLTYLDGNLDRMQYDRYREQGLMIGSGPIEAAHRTVLQVRMKRSGQRWSDHGAANMIRLRTAFTSDKFEIVNNLFRMTDA